MAYQIGDYPLPSHACYVWIEGENLRIGLPPIDGNDRGHSVAIPLAKCSIEQNEQGSAPLTRQLGWKALLDVLHSRLMDHAAKQEFNRIARKSAPIQSQIDQWIKSQGVRAMTQEGHQVLSDEQMEDLLSD